MGASPASCPTTTVTLRTATTVSSQEGIQDEESADEEDQEGLEETVDDGVPPPIEAAQFDDPLLLPPSDDPGPAADIASIIFITGLFGGGRAGPSSAGLPAFRMLAGRRA